MVKEDVDFAQQSPRARNHEIGQGPHQDFDVENPKDAEPQVSGKGWRRLLGIRLNIVLSERPSLTSYLFKY